VNFTVTTIWFLACTSLALWWLITIYENSQMFGADCAAAVQRHGSYLVKIGERRACLLSPFVYPMSLLQSVQHARQTLVPTPLRSSSFPIE